MSLSKNAFYDPMNTNPSEEQLDRIQHALGYRFANIQRLYDALDISGQDAEQGSKDQKRYKARKTKIAQGRDTLEEVLESHVATRGAYSWNRNEKKRAFEIWFNTGTMARVAEELELNSAIIHQPKHNATAESVISDTFLAVLQAMFDDMEERHYSPDVVQANISTLIERHMPTLRHMPVGDQRKTMESTYLLSEANIIGKLHQSDEFSKEGFAFEWDKPSMEVVNDKVLYSQKLRLVQRWPDSAEPKTIIEVTGVNNEDEKDAAVSAVKKMVPELTKRHRFLEMIRNIAREQDGYSYKI